MKMSGTLRRTNTEGGTDRRETVLIHFLYHAMNSNVILSPYMLGTEKEEIITLHVVEVKGRSVISRCCS